MGVDGEAPLLDIALGFSALHLNPPEATELELRLVLQFSLPGFYAATSPVPSQSIGAIHENFCVSEHLCSF